MASHVGCGSDESGWTEYLEESEVDICCSCKLYEEVFIWNKNCKEKYCKNCRNRFCDESDSMASDASSGPERLPSMECVRFSKKNTNGPERLPSMECVRFSKKNTNVQEQRSWDKPNNQRCFRKFGNENCLQDTASSSFIHKEEWREPHLSTTTKWPKSRTMAKQSKTKAMKKDNKD